MAAYSSSSLAFSDHNKQRNGSGLLKNLHTRISKQHLVEHKLFSSRRKNIQIGRKFRKGLSSRLEKDDHPTGVSPSLEEFDKMMNEAVKHTKTKKKLFSRKQFG